ncbi:DUF1643 domain-containing protein [Prosthecomicrobium hirschii]|uniref:DUF1643 domain-containing protein n=1 Tax=Prosthecodimorpha hirschii TaxID=665126 RepID=UPI00221FF8B6|nr:DUF1643 domain-containing protein [Prosthecomicrobium hirschii]
MADFLTRRSAVLSDCGTYRYRLERFLGPGPTVVGVMVNPSTADAEQDDATIRKWLGFAARLGWGRIVIGNLFSYRSTDIAGLRSARDPVGPLNDWHLQDMFRGADTIIVAWGALAKLPPSLRRRWRCVPWPNGIALQCWGTASDGHPLHPLMLSYGTQLRPWSAALSEQEAGDA